MIKVKDTITCFTGGVGSGKSFCATKAASREYTRALLVYAIRKPFYRLLKRDPEKQPLLLTNTPVYLKRRQRLLLWITGNGAPKYSWRLTPDHLMLKAKIPEGSVILIDEFSATLTQFDFKSPNVEILDEFVRWCRHYFNGRIIICDQCSENIVLQVRRRFNLVHNTLRTRSFPFGRSKIFGKFNLFSLVSYRLIYISEEIKDVGKADEKGSETESKEIGIRWAFYFLPFWRKLYETRAYKHRYDTVPEVQAQGYQKAYTNFIIKIPRDKQQAKTQSED